MQSMRMRISLIFVALALFNPFSLLAAPERRIALVIGNSAYSTGPLKNPVNDATDMAKSLQRLGFTVNLKKNADLQTMEEAIENFGNHLKRGGVGLFYYAGHGVQVSGVNYLIPVGAKINKESDVKFKAFDAGRILAEMENANNGVNIVLLDACRDNPFGKSFRSASRGLAIVSNSPSGTFISYSTSPGQVASDGDGRNSPYTRALLENMAKPGLSINNVFMKVRSRIKKETGQIPWELSSLETDFYFVSGESGQASAKQEIVEQDDALQSERMKLDEERVTLQKEKAILEQKQALEEERQKIAEERRKLAMAKRPSVSAGNETRRDGRFIAYDNGTVLDTSTNLMWASKDNGSDINWYDAKSYCKNHRGGGYSDWRMPTQDELAGLYDAGKTQRNEAYPEYPAHVTKLIDLTSCCPWASEASGSDAAYFHFSAGGRGRLLLSGDGVGIRALPVRSGK